MKKPDDNIEIPTFLLHRILGTSIEELLKSEERGCVKVAGILYEQTNKELLNQFDHKFGFYNSLATILSGITLFLIPIIDPLNYLVEIRLVITLFGLVTGFLWVTLNLAKMKQSVEIRIYCSTTWSAIRKWGLVTIGLMMLLWIPLLIFHLTDDVLFTAFESVLLSPIGILALYFGVRFRDDYSFSSKKTWQQLANQYLLSENGFIVDHSLCTTILSEMEDTATRYAHAANATAAFIPVLWTVPLGIRLSQFIGAFTESYFVNIWIVVIAGLLINTVLPIINSLRASESECLNLLYKLKRLLSVSE